jgi:hypothetical protein
MGSGKWAGDLHGELNHRYGEGDSSYSVGRATCARPEGIRVEMV